MTSLNVSSVSDAHDTVMLEKRDDPASFSLFSLCYGTGSSSRAVLQSSPKMACIHRAAGER